MFKPGRARVLYTLVLASAKTSSCASAAQMSFLSQRTLRPCTRSPLNVLTGIYIPMTSGLHPETLRFEEPEVGRDMFLKDAAHICGCGQAVLISLKSSRMAHQ